MVDLGGYVIILVETKDKKVKLYGEQKKARCFTAMQQTIMARPESPFISATLFVRLQRRWPASLFRRSIMPAAALSIFTFFIDEAFLVTAAAAAAQQQQQLVSSILSNGK